MQDRPQGPQPPTAERLAATDADLWRRAAEGDPEAFGELFSRHARAVHAFCARRTGDLSLADDLTSIVFLEAWRRRSQVVLTADHALPWLLGVAANVARASSRARLRYRRAIDRLPAGEPADDDGGVAARVDAQRQLDVALRAVRRLSAAERDVVALVLWSGLTYAEAGTALGVPVGTVRSRLSRARRRLRTALDLPTDRGLRVAPVPCPLSTPQEEP